MTKYAMSDLNKDSNDAKEDSMMNSITDNIVSKKMQEIISSRNYQRLMVDKEAQTIEVETIVEDSHTKDPEYNIGLLIR